MSRLTVALVGLGRVGFMGWPDERIETHYQSIRQHDRLKVVCGVDVNAGAREKFQQITGLPVFERALLAINRERPDVVVICTPPFNHLGVTLDALGTKSVKAILCEKPLSDSVVSAKAVVDACRRNSVALLTGHQRRYETRHAAVRDFIDSGYIGTPVAAKCEFTLGPTGTFLSNGSHAIDTLRFLAGDEIPRSITPGDGFRCTIACEKGGISIESRGSLEPGYLSVMYDDLIKCIETGSEPFCSGTDGLIAVKESLIAEELWNERCGAGIVWDRQSEGESVSPLNVNWSPTTASPTPEFLTRLPRHSTPVS